eukprot:scaffold29905_cov64-Phaeocystis_antarctica.AAC.14
MRVALGLSVGVAFAAHQYAGSPLGIDVAVSDVAHIKSYLKAGDENRVLDVPARVLLAHVDRIGTKSATGGCLSHLQVGAHHNVAQWRKLVEALEQLIQGPIVRAVGEYLLSHAQRPQREEYFLAVHRGVALLSAVCSGAVDSKQIAQAGLQIVHGQIQVLMGGYRAPPAISRLAVTYQQEAYAETKWRAGLVPGDGLRIQIHRDAHFVERPSCLVDDSRLLYLQSAQRAPCAAPVSHGCHNALQVGRIPYDHHMRLSGPPAKCRHRVGISAVPSTKVAADGGGAVLAHIFQCRGEPRLVIKKVRWGTAAKGARLRPTLHVRVPRRGRVAEVDETEPPVVVHQQFGLLDIVV